MISINDLNKTYGSLKVLDRINLAIEDGEAVGIVGPNGSGKTTLIKTILALVKPDDGDIYVNGTHLNGNWQYRSDIGYMQQIARYPENLTVAEVLDMVKDVRQDSPELDTELIDTFRMQSEMNKRIYALSGGNRQKLSAVLAFLFNPSILILDEPTAGLDPRASSQLKDKIEREKANGKTLILTSHIMDEIDFLTDRIVFLLEGRIQFDGPKEQIIQQSGEEVLERAIAQLMEDK